MTTSEFLRFWNIVSEILEDLKSKKETLVEWLKKIEQNDGKEISVVDPEAHLMHTNGDGSPLDACYNVQSVVDSKHTLIVDFEVTTCPDDKNALPEMTENAKEIMGVDTITAVADTGYYDGEDIEKCEGNGACAYVAKRRNDNFHASNEKYDNKHFRYDSETIVMFVRKENYFISVAKKRHDGSKYCVYYDKTVCADCLQKDNCFANKVGFRQIYRNPHQDALDRNNARMTANYEIFKERKKIIEHPFGTTKAVWGYKQYLCRTQERMTAEQSLAFLAYNLRRTCNIFKGNEKNLIEAMV